MTTPDGRPHAVQLLAELLWESGCNVDLQHLAADPGPAGVPDLLPHDGTELTSVGAAACELLATETLFAAETSARTDRPWADAARLRLLARLTGLLLPDVQARNVPATPCDVRIALLLARAPATALLEQLGEHDRGEWVDPQVLAGLVADLGAVTTTGQQP